MAPAPPRKTPVAAAIATVKRSAPRVPAFTAVVVRTADELAEHTAALEELASIALEPNVYLEPWMILPAARAFADSQSLTFVLVYAQPHKRAGEPPTACGFFPLERLRHWKGLPVRVVRIWRHLYSVLGTPLLRAECARECWAFFLNWLADAREGAPLLDLPYITGDGPFSQLIIDDSNERGTLQYVTEAFTRALFSPRASGDHYLAAALSGKHRQEMKRMERRLGETGKLHYAVLEPNEDARLWAGAFLELEARGWKGREGTALARQEADRRFFHAFTRAAHVRGRLQMLGLFLDNRPIALKCNLMAGEGAYAFKIAFDEKFARYSPGVLLEMFTIQHLHLKKDLAWMDSCAIPNHPMINRLWLDRRTIQSVLISTGRVPGDFVVSLLPALRWVKRKMARRSRSDS